MFNFELLLTIDSNDYDTFTEGKKLRSDFILFDLEKKFVLNCHSTKL
jgi:hypothetical protein